MVPGATHNFGERYDAPKCHPETRKAVLSNIRRWVEGGTETTRMMWLHGPAGAGKSAIAQTTAEECYAENKLAVSFFFYRLAGRNKKDGLIATIAYQLCLSIPEMKEHIIKHIEENPNIFKSNLLTQVQSLVIAPFNAIHQAVDHSVLPRLIIIDGLDECKSRKGQVEIIGVVSEASSLDSASHFRFLLVSRPELDIRHAFNSDKISVMCTRLALDDSFDPDKDIDLFIRNGFKAIKGPTLLAGWPSDEAVLQIVQKSSGQFIYASTVIKYVSDSRRDPRKRLDTILRILLTNDKPYAQLDALYSTILLMCEDYNMVAVIFQAMMFLYEDDGNYKMIILQSTKYLESLLALGEEVFLLPADLHSILDLTNKKKLEFDFIILPCMIF